MLDSQAARASIRNGSHRGPTRGLAPGFQQANLVALPRADAFEFLLFALRNPRPCPLIEVIESGVEPVASAPGADLRYDLPSYRLWVDGHLTATATSAEQWWRDDLVAFLLGCSFTFEDALELGGVEVRHPPTGNVPMFVTDRPCVPAGRFSGSLVVSMRPIPEHQVAEAARITERFASSHGPPVHVGDPGEIGIGDLASPDFGEAIDVRPHEVPVFWACGVTPQEAIRQAAVPMAITHDPGHMFITDLPA